MKKNKNFSDKQNISQEVKTIVKGFGKSNMKPYRDKFSKNKFSSESSNKSPLNKKTTKSLIIRDIPDRKQLLVKPGSKWFSSKAELVKVPANELSPRVAEMQKIATNLLEADIALYEKQQGKGRKRAEMSWIKTAIKSGTLVDKIAALTLLIQDSPVHNLSALENMINMIKTKKKRECLMALDSLKELFLSDLLIPETKLKNISQNPIDKIESLCSGNIEMIHRQIMLYHFEEELKKCYNNFISALEVLTHDSVESTKNKALSAMYELLSTNPEQEQYLLTKLVNKLGDPMHRVAAKAARFLALLLQTHPDMNAVVVNEVEYLLYRPNIASKAQYYAVCFLNQILFSKEDDELAAKLINIYFGFFKLCHKKGEVDSKMMSALLTGINRAFPYLAKELDSVNSQMDAMFKIVHTVNINISVQALMLLFQVMDSKDSLSDRFYTTLYRKLYDPELKSCTRQTMLLNLLYKSLKNDSSDERTMAFIRRLLQISKYLGPALVCGILFLISELLKLKPKLRTVLSQSNFISVGFSNDKLDDENSSDEEAPVSSWVHKNNVSQKKSKKSDYDPKERNPLYACADKSCTWELQMLINHFHPSINLFAKTILEGKSIEYDGDPLQDFTLIRFLDRFVFRNPKKLEVSNQNETKSRSVFCKRLLRQLPSAKKIAVDSKDFISQKENQVPIDEKFLFKYFSQRAKDQADMGLNHSDNNSVTSEQFQEFLTRTEPGFTKDLFDIDFAAEFNSSNKKNNKKKQVEESDEDIDFDDDEMNEAFKEYDDLVGNDINDVDDSASDASKDENYEKKSESDFDEEGVDFGGDQDFSNMDAIEDFADDDDDEMPVPKKKKNSKYDTAGLFASAEKFSHMMDENATDVNGISNQALSNKDNAHVKQLKWEMERERKMKGHDWRKKKGSRNNLKRKGNFNKKLSSKRPKSFNRK